MRHWISILILATALHAQIDLTIQKNWTSKVLLSAGYMKKIALANQYMQFGVNLFPEKPRDFTRQPGDSYTYKYDSYYGVYTGYYYAFSALLRIGVHIGAGFKRFREYVNQSSYSRFNGYSDYKTIPYYGLGIQSGMFSFIVSNEGIGGGVNVSFRR